ncbi:MULTISPECIES: molecular chaperone [Citrobacter]|uniref:fimbrial biogenesis chaperone n=1 Tax=Citrobacter TaxID=544 RepID=UPI0007929FD5|nr:MULTISPECIES: molecular chaperone [Citrobacter]MDM2797554.1 molecular chaperone [Citrobacter sp. Cpo131]MDM2894327.1 molecular chaperone [Citrobacter sp. Cpo060]MDW2647348.1 molecular chaperone [Citrobacter portucalensis]SAD66524.1 Pili assembly chaperone [Enterobacter cloacae]
MKRLITILALVLTTGINIAHAGVVIGGTRIIYPASQSEVQVTLKNKDNDKRYLVQSWVSNIDDSKAPFVITPPIYKLDENRQTLLHVVYTGNKTALPQDRESLFMANVKSVSAIPEELRDNNTLQFAIKTKLKLFYRPASLKESEAKTAWQSLQFSRSQNQLVVKNPTPFYVTFGQLTVAGKAIKSTVDQHSPSALTMMVAPFAEQRFPLSSGAKGDVAWTAINDFGSETGQRKQPL